MTTILVVDDSSSDRRLIEVYLEERTDFNVEFAGTGVDALAKMDHQLPDLVVTDLQMPIMDGLQLVTEMRTRFPQTPVILVTSFGNELVAVEALQRGAASYVPKSHLADRLVPTVCEVLALASGGRSDARLMDALEKAEFIFALANDPELIPPLVDLLQQMVAGAWACDQTEKVRIGVALEEVLINAMFFGNLEMNPGQSGNPSFGMMDEDLVNWVEQRRSKAPYCDRKISIHATITVETAKFVVRDGGPGFDPSSLPQLGERGTFIYGHGRGTMLIQTFMDEVIYNETGNEVTLLKRREGTTGTTTPPVTQSPFELHQTGDTLLIVPRENITSPALERIQVSIQAILELIEESSVKNVVVDFGRVPRFGVTMLNVLRQFWKPIRARGGKMVICNLSSVGENVIRVSGFDTLWEMHSSRPTALEALSR